jgi:hypothetical protein
MQLSYLQQAEHATTQSPAGEEAQNKGRVEALP